MQNIQGILGNKNTLYWKHATRMQSKKTAHEEKKRNRNTAFLLSLTKIGSRELFKDKGGGGLSLPAMAAIRTHPPSPFS